ncbi:MAG: polymerase subunit epsilon [Rhodospirillales bacterium]|nr:polymerase subunit epsilon [Rhodospirillales bacterium]
MSDSYGAQGLREIVLDTETTGLDPRHGHRIVEIGCLELVNHIPTDRHFHRYINPECDISDEAVAVHGLTRERLSKEPVFAAIAGDFLDFIGDAKLVIHNADFDVGFLNAELAALGLPQMPPDRATCTVKMARRRFPGAPANLDALCRRFGVDNSGRALHGALLDAQLLAECYVELLGGRQHGLALAVETAAASVAIAGVVIQRTPRAHGPNESEIAAHAAMIASLKAPLWLGS